MNHIKKSLKPFFVFAFLALALFSFASAASAVDLTVTCADEGPCEMTPSPGKELFYETNWLPGDTVTRNITIINNDVNDDCNLYLDTRNEQDANNLSSVIFTVIKLGVNDLYGIRDGSDRASSNRTLRNLFDAGDIYLTTIPKLDNRIINWTATFDPNAGNPYQGKKTVFDFDLHFSCGIPPGPSPSPSPSSSPGPGVSPSPSVGAAGVGGGTPTTPTPTPLLTTGFLPRLFARGPSVAGVTAEEGKPEEGAIAGGQIGGAQSCCPKICPWWWILLMLQVLLLTRYFLKKAKRIDDKDWALLPIGLTLVSILSHFILHQIFVSRLGYVASPFCGWFWAVSAVVTFLLAVIFNWVTGKEEGNKKKNEK